MCVMIKHNLKRLFCRECRKGVRAPVLVQMQDVGYLDLTSDSGNEKKCIN